MLFDLFVLFLPAYIANAMPVLLGGKMPMDFNKKFLDGKRILGKGKTIQGFLGGIFSGISVGFILSFIYNPFGISSQNQFLIAILMSIGAMIGDSIGSFIKRRFGVKGEYPFIDQMPFIITAILFSYPLIPKLDLLTYFGILLFTYVLHKTANIFAYYIGIKKVPW